MHENINVTPEIVGSAIGDVPTQGELGSAIENVEVNSSRLYSLNTSLSRIVDRLRGPEPQSVADQSANKPQGSIERLSLATSETNEGLDRYNYLISELEKLI